jgi:hypothetical protein
MECSGGFGRLRTLFQKKFGQGASLDLGVLKNYNIVKINFSCGVIAMTAHLEIKVRGCKG